MKRIPNASIYHSVHSMHECQIAIAARLHRWRGGAVWCAMEVAWQHHALEDYVQAHVAGVQTRGVSVPRYTRPCLVLRSSVMSVW